MADSFLVDETEISNEQEEEDPILVAQRYLNIFHQIHIFNAAKKEEFDKSLLAMDEKTKELLATIPGGRVLLEHVKEIEEKQGINSGETTELIAQNIEEEKKSIDSLKQSSGSGGGELTLSSDFAESLANSLAAALKNNNVASTPSGGNMEDLAQLLNKSFNAYAASMQTLTRSLVSHNGNTAMQQTVAQPQQPMSAAANIPPQAMAAQQNNSSTTVNNINMDTSYFNNINQTLMQSDARRHQDMMQIVEALNKNIQPTNTGSGIATAAVSEMQTLAIANSVTEALRQNCSQQMEAIKAFGEMLVQAFTQSQQELAQTLAQSAPRHTVKVVVSQDVDVEDQTGGTAAVTAKPAISQPKKNEPAPKKEPEQKNDKSNFIKNFSDKISETTNKITQNLSSEAKNTSDSLLNRINKSLNKINDLKNQGQNKNNNQQPAKKADDKAVKNENPQPKKDNQPKNQPQNQNKNNTTAPAAPAQPQNKEQPKPAQNKPQPPKEPAAPEVKNIQTKQPEQPKPTAFQTQLKPQPQPQPQAKPQPPKEELSLADILAEIPTESSSAKSSAPDIFADNSFGTPAKSSAPDIFSDNSFGEPAKSSAPDIFSDNSFGEPVKPAAKPVTLEPKNKADTAPQPQQTQAEPLKEYKKSQLHSYEDALLKIKNALSSDDDISLNNMDVKPISLGHDDDLPKPAPQPAASKPTAQPALQPQKNKDEELWSFDDDDTASADSSDDGDWEYVDENGNPVSGDDGGWEYVDENGNPVSGNDGDWEYVDENGNPVSGDDGDWEYVDENGNPVSGDDGDWEYVDENGNPIENK